MTHSEHENFECQLADAKFYPDRLCSLSCIPSGAMPSKPPVCLCRDGHDTNTLILEPKTKKPAPKDGSEAATAAPPKRLSKSQKRKLRKVAEDKAKRVERTEVTFQSRMLMPCHLSPGERFVKRERRGVLPHLRDASVLAASHLILCLRERQSVGPHSPADKCVQLERLRTSWLRRC